ncbi:hypothetical protein UlMin_022571 [Ulmus minor]
MVSAGKPRGDEYGSLPGSDNEGSKGRKQLKVTNESYQQAWIFQAIGSNELHSTDCVFGEFIQERIDRYVDNMDWCRLFPNFQVSNLSFYHYDNRVVKITLGSSRVWVKKSPGKGRKGRFHFEEVWTTYGECKEVIAAAWGLEKSTGSVEGVVDRLKECVVKTDSWGFRKFGRIKRDIAKLQVEIESKKRDGLYGVSLPDILDIETRLESLHNQEEIYWKQRSRMKWLAFGDRNSKVFHQKASREEGKIKYMVS